MLWIRNKGGVATPLPEDAAFLEMRDLQGNVAAVFFIANDGGVHMVKGTDHQAARYAKLFNVKFVDLVTVPEDQIIHGN
jgi:hypothetical protein